MYCFWFVCMVVLNPSIYVVDSLIILAFLKASCEYAFQTSTVLKETGYYLIKECLHQLFLFLLLKSVNQNLMKSKRTEREYLICNVIGVYESRKTSQELQRKFVMLNAEVSLLTYKCETGFQSFVLTIHH